MKIRNRKYRIAGLLAVVLFQLLVLLFEYGMALYPVWTGEEIKLKTKPVDPRSMFRGNYARLQYEISTIPGEAVGTERIPRNGEIVFVALQKDANGIYSYSSASLKKPESGLFIKGRITTYSSKTIKSTYRVRYGIEAFFAPKEKAIQLEKRLRDTAIARIKIASNGKAALVDVVGEK